MSIAVDIGATNIRAASGTEDGFDRKLVENTDKDNGPEGVSVQIIRMINKLGVKPEVVGVGSIGPLNVHEGVITNTPNYPFKNIHIVKPLVEAFNVPVLLLNDCGAAVIGEQRFGRGKRIDDLFYVTISTGLGGGAIVDGHPLKGKDGNAPEIGHIVVDPWSEIVCGCGCRGHWEAFSSGANMPNYARHIVRRYKLSSSILFKEAGSCLENLNSEMIFTAARGGDDTARKIVDEIAEINAVGFADIVNVFDPELITVGGSVALSNPDLVLEPIRLKINKYLINRCPEIVITPLSGDIVLYGALAAILGR